MKRVAPPCCHTQQRAWECSYVLLDHCAELSPVARTHVELVHRMHPDDLGWLSVVRMFVLYRDVLGERV